MSKYKWDLKSTLLFLEKYKNHPCLWNHKTDGYKDKTQRSKAMRSIIRDLNIEDLNEEDIKRKIKTIRTRYTAELSRIKQSASGGSSENSYVPSLYWFKSAEFLSSVSVPRQSSATLVSNVKTEHLSESSNNNDSNGIDELYESECHFPPVSCKQESNVKTEHLSESSINNDSNGIDELYESEYQPEQYSCDTAVGHQLTADEPDDYTEPKPRHDEEVYYNTINEENAEEEHEFDLFCKSLAVQLKKMPLERALVCQQKLQSVMVQERLSSIRSHESPSDRV